MSKRPKIAKKPGFWARCRELHGLLELKVAQGHAQDAMKEALLEQIRNGAVQAIDPELAKSVKKAGLPAEFAQVIADAPPGGQLKMSAAEYRKLMGQ